MNLAAEYEPEEFLTEEDLDENLGNKILARRNKVNKLRNKIMLFDDDGFTKYTIEDVYRIFTGSYNQAIRDARELINKEIPKENSSILPYLNKGLEDLMI